jgi:hypothetical protein
MARLLLLPLLLLQAWQHHPPDQHITRRHHRW